MNSNLWKNRLYKAVDITKNPYLNSYPSLNGLLVAETRIQKVSANLLVRCKDSFSKGCIPENNLATDDISFFVNFSKLNFSLKPRAYIYHQIAGFQAIPFHNIGRHPH
jgi:hypothetical protein